ncbi:MAG: lysozyme [Candidatus Liberibacter ctenarytainae]|uniref:Lysozyme n=1 Tax=Candidatus Liberibacter ctenarytainae TaxID=2020335 RepID=A0A937APY7_9HYPH|nr:lysozyme [Candidatus Liberibacter ctenarytainae]
MKANVYLLGKANALLLLLQDSRKCLNQVLRASLILASSSTSHLSVAGDFVFNCGISRYKHSTSKKRIDEEDWFNASLECKRWVFAGGKK